MTMNHPISTWLDEVMSRREKLAPGDWWSWPSLTGDTEDSVYISMYAADADFLISYLTVLRDACRMAAGLRTGAGNSPEHVARVGRAALHALYGDEKKAHAEIYKRGPG